MRTLTTEVVVLVASAVLADTKAVAAGIVVLVCKVCAAAILPHEVIKDAIVPLKVVTAAAIVAGIPEAKPAFKTPQAVIMLNILVFVKAELVNPVISAVCNCVTCAFKFVIVVCVAIKSVARVLTLSFKKIICSSASVVCKLSTICSQTLSAIVLAIWSNSNFAPA